MTAKDKLKAQDAFENFAQKEGLSKEAARLARQRYEEARIISYDACGRYFLRSGGFWHRDSLAMAAEIQGERLSN